MNFISHHYLQSKKHNDHFSVGVTFPDILSLHHQGTVLNRTKFTHTISLTSLSQEHSSLLRGMSEHLKADKIFHSSRFFKKQLLAIQREAIKTGLTPVPEITRHILLEILMDRYLVLKHRDAAEDFYNLYERFPFSTILPVLHSFTEFNDARLLSFIEGFTRKRYFLKYAEIHGVADAIERVNLSFNTGYTFVQPDCFSFFEKLYDLLIDEIIRFFDQFTASR